MTLSPFEIRLNILQIAKDLVLDEYHSKREEHAARSDINKNNPPLFPTSEEFVKKANELNQFVSHTK